MQRIDTKFAGLFIIELDVYKDQRGEFYETWRDDDYQSLGILRENQRFLQDNTSVSNKNVLRGLHYQQEQGQLVTIIHGEIFDVVVDIREHSSTYLQYFSTELSSEKHKQLYMAPGLAHGFYVLSDIAIINYKCTQYYNQNQEGGLLWNDPRLKIQWPCNEPIVSIKDLSYA